MVRQAYAMTQLYFNSHLSQFAQTSKGWKIKTPDSSWYTKTLLNASLKCNQICEHRKIKTEDHSGRGIYLSQLNIVIKSIGISNIYICGGP